MNERVAFGELNGGGTKRRGQDEAGREGIKTRSREL